MLSDGGADEENGEEEESHSLLLAPTQPVREWAAHCLGLLLKTEVNNNNNNCSPAQLEGPVQLSFQSEFLKSVQAKRKSFTALVS